MERVVLVVSALYGLLVCCGAPCAVGQRVGVCTLVYHTSPVVALLPLPLSFQSREKTRGG